MHELKDLIPPLELCRLIPAGEFGDTAFVRIGNTKIIALRHSAKWSFANQPHIPAPTFDEILDELHKCQEDVFVKWSETAYQGWLVNAYSHGRNEDYQAHDERKTTAALKVWLKMKGINCE